MLYAPSCRQSCTALDIDKAGTGILDSGNRISFDLTGLKSFFIVQARIINAN